MIPDGWHTLIGAVTELRGVEYDPEQIADVYVVWQTGDPNTPRSGWALPNFLADHETALAYIRYATGNREVVALGKLNEVSGIRDTTAYPLAFMVSYEVADSLSPGAPTRKVYQYYVLERLPIYKNKQKDSEHE